jgi:predicted phosphoribosyltransferase
MRRFTNRSEAGRELAGLLHAVLHRDDHVVVLGVPRGGIPVAVEVAEALGAPLGVVTVQRELERCEELYRADRPSEPVAGRTAIVVDDGVATGSTMTAAVTAVRRLGPRRIILAAPVASREAAEALGKLVDTCVWGYVPVRLYSVALWYEDFTPPTDAQVISLRRRVTAPSSGYSRQATWRAAPAMMIRSPFPEPSASIR